MSQRGVGGSARRKWGASAETSLSRFLPYRSLCHPFSLISSAQRLLLRLQPVIIISLMPPSIFVLSFKGIGLDFLTEILPGAELALPEVAEQHLEALADAEEVRLHAAAAAAEAEAESEAESEDDEEAGGAFALLGEEDEEDEEDEEEEGVDIAADLDVVDEDEEEEEEEEEEGGAFDGAEE